MAQIFLYVSIVFFLFCNNKTNYAKNVAFFPSTFSIKMATQKFTNFDQFFFFMYTDMTAVTITIKKKLISNEVKNNLAILEPSYGKKQMRLLAKPIF